MTKNNKRKSSEDRPLQVNGASRQVTDLGGGEKMNNLNDQASVAPEELVGRLTEIGQMLLRVKTSYLDANQEFSGLRAQLEQIQIQKQGLQNERDTLLRELDGLKAILVIQKKSIEEELALLIQEKENILGIKREEAEHRQLLEDEKKTFGEKQKELLEKVAELEQKGLEAEQHELALRSELEDLQKSRDNYSERVLDFQNEIEMLRKENAAILTQREDEINRFQELTYANAELTQQLDAHKRDLDESMRMLLDVEQKSNALIEEMKQN
jgi:chromosome segregation ATPase